MPDTRFAWSKGKLISLRSPAFYTDGLTGTYGLKSPAAFTFKYCYFGISILIQTEDNDAGDDFTEVTIFSVEGGYRWMIAKNVSLDFKLAYVLGRFEKTGDFTDDYDYCRINLMTSLKLIPEQTARNGDGNELENNQDNIEKRPPERRFFSIFVAFLPQIVNPSRAALPQLTLLGGMFLLINAVKVFLYALLAGRLGDYIKQAGTRKWLHRCGGTVLIGAGIFTTGMQWSS